MEDKLITAHLRNKKSGREVVIKYLTAERDSDVVTDAEEALSLDFSLSELRPTWERVGPVDVEYV